MSSRHVSIVMAIIFAHRQKIFILFLSATALHASKRCHFFIGGIVRAAATVFRSRNFATVTSTVHRATPTRKAARTIYVRRSAAKLAATRRRAAASAHVRPAIASTSASIEHASTLTSAVNLGIAISNAQIIGPALCARASAHVFISTCNTAPPPTI